MDFASPFSLTSQRNQYVLVMIKHFAKWLELVPLLNHKNEGATYVFMEMEMHPNSLWVSLGFLMNLDIFT
jgi:hypothetical protein